MRQGTNPVSFRGGVHGIGGSVITILSFLFLQTSGHCQLLVKPRKMTTNNLHDIAIIGMGLRFPGAVETKEAFWELLCGTSPAIRPVPESRTGKIKHFLFTCQLFWCTHEVLLLCPHPCCLPPFPFFLSPKFCFDLLLVFCKCQSSASPFLFRIPVVYQSLNLFWSRGWTANQYVSAEGKPGCTVTDRAGLFYFAFPRLCLCVSGWVDGVDRFDPQAFKISPKEAAEMDPQQRLVLECTYEALLDAYINPTTLAGSNTGVYVGAGIAEYMAMAFSDPDNMTSHTMSGVHLPSGLPYKFLLVYPRKITLFFFPVLGVFKPGRNLLMT